MTPEKAAKLATPEKKDQSSKMNLGGLSITALAIIYYSICSSTMLVGPALLSTSSRGL